ncbi:uncharacterized protein TRIADDRAFT_61206 [Trichoplax adhaerens]|uniref:rRNA biogenesis protein RRP36 n=1 Tax=Trichoplax adhaerens TaxID=10228 RepID=B3SAB8_TRIAD|nr:hypothetical protein TRIADDRAFT_61206 [Trichoplax adhaerens]EDV20232.1 hypothetical protein TRIADDRAFT_61206 [Trichoplax adhaerens]|eukprot:XP_002117182.1 hypothetical protein TRIADDRAFT_61206 [Trichoplax adhaerens]
MDEEDLTDIPFADLQKLRDQVGIKRYNQAIRNTEGKKGNKLTDNNTKYRPQEFSSKKPVSVLRQIHQTKKSKPKDPRFTRKSGTLNEDLFEKSFGFIKELKTNEEQMLIKQLHKTKDKSRKAEISAALERLNQQQQHITERKQKQEIIKQHRKKEIELIEKGKKPFYLKRSMKKQMFVEQKHDTLKKQRKLDKYLKRKTRRDTAKERAKMPKSRQVTE